MKSFIIGQIFVFVADYIKAAVGAVGAALLAWFVAKNILGLSVTALLIVKWTMMVGTIVFVIGKIVFLVVSLASLQQMASQYNVEIQDIVEALQDYDLQEEMGHPTWTPEEFQRWLNAKRSKEETTTVVSNKTLFRERADAYQSRLRRIKSNLFTGSRTATCPRCDTKHQIRKDVRKYMCTSCRALLLLGEDATTEPSLSDCPYCGLQTAVTVDYGHFTCPNCGIVREPNSIECWTETQACPRCGEFVPSEAIYCKSCKTILRSDFPTFPEGYPVLSYDMDWRIGKDAIGHYHFARALLKGIREGTRVKSSVAEVQVLLSNLEDALISIEEALQDPETRSHVESVLLEIDTTYKALLSLELRCLQAMASRPANCALEILANEPHIRARRRVESILGDSLSQGGGIGNWSEKLVRVNRAKDTNGKTEWRVTDYEKLRAEVVRFTDWGRSGIPAACEVHNPCGSGENQ